MHRDPYRNLHREMLEICVDSLENCIEICIGICIDLQVSLCAYSSGTSQQIMI